MKFGDLIRDKARKRVGVILDIYESIVQIHYKVLSSNGKVEWFPTNYESGSCEVINENR